MKKRIISLLLVIVLAASCFPIVPADAAALTQESAVTSLLKWAQFTQADADIVGGWVELAYYVDLVLDTDTFDPDAPCTSAYYNTLRKRANELYRQNLVSKIPIKPFIKIDQQTEDIFTAWGEDAVFSVDAAVSNGTALSCQWYVCVDKDKTDAAPIPGATQATFSASTQNLGSLYFFCRLSAENMEPVDTDVVCLDVFLPTIEGSIPLDAFEHTLDTQNRTVLLSKYTGDAPNVVVPPFYTIDGTLYTTVLDSTTVFRGNRTITDVKLYKGVSFANHTMENLFFECENLVKADLSGVNTSGVTNMSAAFTLCEKLTTLDMTGIDTSSVTTMYYLFRQCSALTDLIGYKDWDTSSLLCMKHTFDRMLSIDEVDLRNWDLSKVTNSGWCFQGNQAKQILLPDNLKTISAGFMNHAVNIEGTTFTIPAGVEKIGYGHTFYDFGTSAFTEFVVAEGNKNYKAVGGILYSADGKEMLAIPQGKTFENNTYVVPEGVEFFGELSFSINKNFDTVLLPNSYEIIQNVPAGDPRYIIFEDNGNLNSGNSLTIAIYRNTAVTKYAVKEDNPRYASDKGIIYSKDMTTLLVVPRRYKGTIDIPDGVTTIAYNAFYSDELMNGCTGINIPASLTNIAVDQFNALNALQAKYPGFVITVDENNPVHSLDANGTLGTKSPYIQINQQPKDLSPVRGEDAVLSVEAVGTNNVTLSYQWYSCDDKNKTNATPIEGATGATYTAPTEMYGDYYYFCRISADGLQDIDSDVICVDVTLPTVEGSLPLSAFEYTVDAQNGNVLLSKYTGTEKNVVVPPSYLIDKTAYNTVLDSATVFYKNTRITDVKLCSGVSFANNTMANLFYGCSSLVKADLSGVNATGVTDMTAAFEGCKKLTTLDMTDIDTSAVTTMEFLFYDCNTLTSIAGYEYWDTSSLKNISGSFNAVSKLKIVDLSRWDLSKIESSRICFQKCKAEQILLPDNLKTINAFFMNHAEYVQGTTFTIPAGVEAIGYDHVFYNFGTSAFTEFFVAKGNENFKAIDGILYSADGKKLLAIPKGKTFENGIFEIPEGVEFLGMLCFSRNPNIQTVVLSNSLELKFVPARDPAYTLPGDRGNINPGNNLNLAIYIQDVKVTSYEVKADNPRYISKDGIIYSKDGTTLVAIPTWYKGYMNIPEGVTTIAYEASLGDSSVDNRMSECTGIYIPASLTNISPDQFDKLNRLQAKYPGKFVITVSPDNPVYTLDANGALGTKSPYIQIN